LDSAGDPAYPTAGLGFSWQDKNAPFDLTKYSAGGQTGVIGIKFWAAAADATHPFAVQFPDQETDVAVVKEGDKFTTECTCKQTGCTPPTSSTIIGTVTPSTTSLNTCFAFYRMNFLPTDTNWHEYTVLFKDLAPGDEITAPSAPGPTTFAYPWADTSVPFDLTQALKVQFGMYQPAAGATPVENDFCVTDVDLVMSNSTCPSGVDNCGGG
jgi:hypothetical protein